MRRGKIETLRPEHDPRRWAAPTGAPLGGEVYAYRRTGDPCLVCGTPIAHAEHLARNLFWCPTCQPADPERTNWPSVVSRKQAGFGA